MMRCSPRWCAAVMSIAVVAGIAGAIVIAVRRQIQTAERYEEELALARRDAEAEPQPVP